MGREREWVTFITVTAGDHRSEANDNCPDEKMRLIEQVLRGSSAADDKGLWWLADMFDEWACELYKGPDGEGPGSGGRRALVARLLAGQGLVVSDGPGSVRSRTS